MKRWEFAHDTHLHPGTYRVEHLKNGLRLVFICCPFGHIGSLHLHSSEGHTIADDGTVDPSLVCAHDFCSFHEHILLMDWTTYSKTESERAS